MPKFPQSFRFDLANPLSCYIKDLADFLQGLHASVIQAIAQTKHISRNPAPGGRSVRTRAKREFRYLNKAQRARFSNQNTIKCTKKYLEHS